MAEPTPAPVAQQEVATQVIEEPVGYGEASLDAVVDHVVYPGDTLDNIALQYGVSKVEIMRLNNLSSETDLQEGQRLRIPVAK
jgi:LysM repeat protein